MGDAEWIPSAAYVEAQHHWCLELAGQDAGPSSVRPRDPGLLMSALCAPFASFAGEYAHPDAASRAVALLSSIVRDHPFTDGNKRAGALAFLQYMAHNGMATDLGADEIADAVIRIASGEAMPDGTPATEFLASHIDVEHPVAPADNVGRLLGLTLRDCEHGMTSLEVMRDPRTCEVMRILHDSDA